MASRFAFLFGLLFLAGKMLAEMSNLSVSEVMEEQELLGLFEVVGAILEDSEWAQLHQQPCTDTPWPGIQCEIAEDQDPSIFHVTKIHIGPDIVNPPCKPSATLSHSLLKLPYLKTLSIFSCFSDSPITLSPTLFGALSQLEHLALESNPSLCGNIPSSLAKITSLRVLSLSQNNLDGKIPREIGGLVNLEQLDLSFNNLSGEIPQEIGALKSLTILDLSWNHLETNLPCSLGQLQLVQEIDISSNRLMGEIPSNLGMLKKLVLLDLSYNLINGPIPESLTGLENLQYLIMDHNPLNSEMPMCLIALKKLTSLSLSGCGVKGQIPNSLFALKNLSALSLDNNNLSGQISDKFGELSGLNQLNLSQNQLSGELLLPVEFIHKLGKRLDVRGNRELCINNQLYEKNISLYLQVPVCLNRKVPRNDRNIGREENPDDCKPSLNHTYSRSSSTFLFPWSRSVFSLVFCHLGLLL